MVHRVVTLDSEILASTYSDVRGNSRRAFLPVREQPRHSASYAVAALRKAMKKTQTSFAVEVLGTAVSTVARYETSHAPSGDVLLRLASIAERQGLSDLQNTFRTLYADEVFAKFGFRTEAVSSNEMK